MWIAFGLFMFVFMMIGIGFLAFNHFLDQLKDWDGY